MNQKNQRTSFVQTGLEKASAQSPEPLQRGAFGIVMNQASIDQHRRLSCDVLSEWFPGQLRAIFSPQHGLWGEEQANMIESPDRFYDPLDLPIYSLYSETRRPTADMLEGINCLVIDLQDVGTRVYTFVWTMLECLHACADAQIPVVVFDRPNPLGGLVVEGPVLDADFTSFVGNAQIPLRHGLTMGELARLFCAEQNIDAELHVVPMTGWRRGMLFPQTGLPWMMPSPNMPRFETAVLYPGQVLLEGINLSEGRGTTTPFEVVGAPFIDGWQLAAALAEYDFPGVSIRPVRFRPTFDKWQQQVCSGVCLTVNEPQSVRSLKLTLAILKFVYERWGDSAEWLPPPYEYEYDRPPIDILYGSDRLRKSLELAASADCDRLAACDESAWRERVANYLLYESP